MNGLPPATDRQRAAVRELLALLADRSVAEVQIKQIYESAREELEREYNAKSQAAEKQYENSQRHTERNFRTKARQMKSEFETELSRLELEYESSLARIAEKAEVNEKATKNALQEAIWLTETVYEATEPQPREQYSQACKGIDGKLEELQTTQEKAVALLKRYRQRIPVAESMGTAAAPAPPAASTLEEVIKYLDERLDDAKARLLRLEKMFIPRLFHLFGATLFILCVIGVAVVIGRFMRGWHAGATMWLDAGIGATAAMAMLAVMYAIARTHIAHLYAPLSADVASARMGAETGRQLAEAQRDRHAAELIAKRDKDLKDAHEKYEPILDEINERRAFHIAKFHERFPREIAELKRKFEGEKQAVDAEFQSLLAQMQQKHEQEARDAETRYTANMK